MMSPIAEIFIIATLLICLWSDFKAFHDSRSNDDG